jgi:hypothetical protein
MSGSQGDSTFSTGRAGDYIRRRVDPAQPRTTVQQARRSSFSAFSAEWRTLTEAQRSSWKALAPQVTLTDRYGNTYHPSGQQLFVGNNLRIELNGDSPLLTAPAVPESANISAGDFTATRSAAGAATDVLRVADVNGVGVQAILVYATAPYSAGRSYVSPSAFRLVTVLSGGSNQVENFRAEYEALFGRPVTGTKISVKLIAMSQSGFAGTPIVETSTVTATA